MVCLGYDRALTRHMRVRVSVSYAGMCYLLGQEGKGNIIPSNVTRMKVPFILVHVFLTKTPVFHDVTSKQMLCTQDVLM